MNGILVVDKPTGPTSHDVVAQVRRLLTTRVGHTGTLDPMATGVLPLVCGSATKLSQYLLGGEKSYEAVFTLGITTRTLDGEGEIVKTSAVNCDEQAIVQAVAARQGVVLQVPPMYSAKKVGGKKLYQLARLGMEIAREAKTVCIKRFEVTKIALPEVSVSVTCSAGTYVRVMAADLGDDLGCGAHLKSLRRIQAGPFVLKQAVPLATLLMAPNLLQAYEQYLLPVEQALSQLGKLDIPNHLLLQLKTKTVLFAADCRYLHLPPFTKNEALTLNFNQTECIGICRTQLDSSQIEHVGRDHPVLVVERFWGRGQTAASPLASAKGNNAYLRIPV